MGVDLTLLPIYGLDAWFAHTQLNLERRRDLWTPFMTMDVHDVPKGFTCYLAHLPNGERGYGELTTDPYGSPVKWVKAADIKTLKEHEGVRDNEVNRAAWAYISELPDDWPVVLYWH